ncbi:FtsX-like permease family protein [Antribacter gilvus]|uniref:FtsX-like permease family protein n=1 Tax=Antribacter gilvus TaxID=2304675 RepID=UPI000F7A062A|nr:FtsX-like permease family protein [Antribacter gilvus]
MTARALRATVQALPVAAHRARRHAGFVAAYGALTAVVALGALAAPLALTRAADDGLRAAVAAAGRDADVVVRYVGREGTDLRHPESFVESLTAAADGGLPPALRAVTGDPVSVLRTAGLNTLTPAGPYSLRLVHAPDAAVTWVAGGAPGTPDDGAAPDDGGSRAVEVGLSAATAEAMGVGPGDMLTLSSEVLTARVAGVFEPVAADDLAWTDAGDLLAPGPLREGASLRPASALLPAESLGTALEVLASGSATIQVRFPLDEAALRADDATTLRSDLVRAATTPDALASTTAGTPMVETVLDGVLDAYAARLAVARGQAATVLTGLAAAGGLVLFLAASLLVARRRQVLELERARGASVASVALRAAAESVPLTVLAAVAAVAATLPSGGPPSGPEALPAVAVLAVAAGAPVVLAARVAASSWAGRRVAANRRDRERDARARRTWRTSAEATVVGLAAAAVAAALFRGVVPDGDPLVAAAPILLAGACTVVVLRVLPLLLGVAERAASRGRGLVPLVAASRAAGGRTGVRGVSGASAAAPVLALTITAALTVSCAAAAATVQQAQKGAAAVVVGAAARVDGPDEDLAALALTPRPDVTTAAGTVLPRRTFARGSGLKTTVLVVDAAAFPQLTALADAGLPALGGPVPALLDPRLERTARLLEPDVWALDSTVPLVVAGVLDLAATGPHLDVTGPPTVPVVVVDRAALAASLGLAPGDLPVDVVWLDGPGAQAAVEELRDAGASSGTVTTREERATGLRTDPLAVGLVTLYLLAAGMLAALAVAAVALTVLATAPERTRVLAVLRTLGTPRAAGRALTAAELAPVLAAAVAAGLASGVLVAVLLTSAQDLGSLAGGGDPALLVPWWPFALVVGVTAAALAAAVAAEARSRRHVRIGDVLRTW